MNTPFQHARRQLTRKATCRDLQNDLEILVSDFVSCGMCTHFLETACSTLGEGGQFIGRRGEWGEEEEEELYCSRKEQTQ